MLHNSTPRRIIPFYGLILLFLLLTPCLQAQFTTWQAGASSDYNVNINWAATPNFVCDCTGGSTDQFKIFLSGQDNNPLYIVTRGHSNTPWSGAASFPFGPSYSFSSASYNNILSLKGGWSDFAGISCFSPCAPSIIPGNTLQISTEPLRKVTGLNVTSDFSGVMALNWNVTTHIPEADYSLEIYVDGILDATYTNKSQETHNTAVYNTGVQHNIEVRTIYTGNTVLTASEDIIHFIPPPNGQFNGSVTTLTSGSPVGGVLVTATLQNPAGISYGADQPQDYTGITDNNGDYVIPFVYYGLNSEMATYKVYPTLEGHGFDPDTNTLTMQAGNFIKTQNFVDTTSFVISGHVISGVAGCGLEGVLVQEAPPGNNGIVSVMTDADGFYELVVPEPGIFNVMATYNGGSIPDSVMTANVMTSDVIGVDFLHTESDTIRGFVGAGCREYIGEAFLEIKTLGGCVLASGVTNQSGFYEFVVPTIPLTLQVSSFTLSPGQNIEETDVLVAISDIISIELEETTELDFVYRKPIQLEVQGLPDPHCALLPYPILKQDQFYILLINVWEEINVCPSDTGTIYITDFISGTSTENQILDTLPIINGTAQYVFQAGEPALFDPYLKGLTVTAIVGNQVEVFTLQAIVTGARQRGATFTTAAPTSLPFLILRDPPGDGSYSFFEENETIKYGQSFSTEVGGALKIWAKVKSGINIFGIKIWGAIGGSFSVDASGSTTDQFEMSISNSNSFSTSNNPLIIGTKGDLFMGAAVNFIYSLADERRFDLNTCSIVKDTVLMFNANGFETTFIYSENHIRTVVVPSLQLILDNPSTADSIRSRFESEIRVWEQTLQLNEDLKADALANSVNYSFDGAIGSFGQTVVGSSTESRTIEFTTKINIDVAAEAGIGFGGTEVSAGVDVNFRTNIGESSTTSQSNTTSTGYFVNDDDIGDALSFDVAIDPVYGTPVFGNVVGQTSCPNEPGTLKRDQMNISVLNPVVESNTNDAFFTFMLENTSESGENRSYRLAFNAISNEFGAEIFLGANDFSTPVAYNGMAPGQIFQTIRVHRPEGLPHFNFEGLEFEFYPACDINFKKKVNISAYFNSPCSSIEMDTPEPGWLINQASSDQLAVNMNGYDLNTNIVQIILQYKKTNSNSWSSSNVVVTPDQLSNGPNGTTFMWDVSYVEDEEYDIRFRLNCATTFSYSPRVTGRIDRSPPMVIGIEKPLNDNYISGSEISVRFDEELDCSLLSNANVFLKRISDGLLIPVAILCDDNKVELIPDLNISGQLIEAFICEIMSPTDLYGNVNEDTIQWVFVVGDKDTDGDGIFDLHDRCPDGDDFVDSDLGGIPDDCDCLPEIEQNDVSTLICQSCDSLRNTVMHFDGGDDYIQLDTAFSDVSNSFTYEFWVNPEDSLTSNITQIGVGINPIMNNEEPTLVYPIQGENAYGAGHSTAGMIVGLNGVVVLEHSTLFYTTPLVHYMPIKGWTHIAISFENKQASLYVNGQFVKQGLVSTLMNFVHPSSKIGGHQSTFFQGALDELRIWNRPMADANEVQSLMFTPPILPNADLALYYAFEEGEENGDNSSLTSLIDLSSLNLNGNVVNFSKNGNISNWITGPIISFKDDDADSVADDCDACASSDDTRDQDLDGIPDGCDDCNVDLILTAANGPLTGVFRASQSITLGVGAEIPVGVNLNLKAPLVKVTELIEAPATSTITIDPAGCQE